MDLAQGFNGRKNLEEHLIEKFIDNKNCYPLVKRKLHDQVSLDTIVLFIKGTFDIYKIQRSSSLIAYMRIYIH